MDKIVKDNLLACKFLYKQLRPVIKKIRQELIENEDVTESGKSILVTVCSALSSLVSTVETYEQSRIDEMAGSATNSPPAGKILN